MREDRSIGPAAQLDPVSLGVNAQPERASFRRQGSPALMEIPKHPKVDMQNQIPSEVISQMLADGIHAQQFAPIKNFSVGEATVRRIHAHTLARKNCGV